MNKPIIEEIIALQCKNGISKEDIKIILEDKSISTHEYNKGIIRILANKSEGEVSNLKVENFMDQKILKEVEESSVALRKVHKTPTSNLDFFYSIDNCPSYLYNSSLLEREDFEAFANIYSDMHGLYKNPNNDQVVDCIKDFMEEYIKDLFDRLGDNVSNIENLIDALEK